MVERGPEKAGVGGSIPSLATTHLSQLVAPADHLTELDEFFADVSLFEFPLAQTILLPAGSALFDLQGAGLIGML